MDCFSLLDRSGKKHVLTCWCSRVTMVTFPGLASFSYQSYRRQNKPKQMGKGTSVCARVCLHVCVRWGNGECKIMDVVTLDTRTNTHTHTYKPTNHISGPISYTKPPSDSDRRPSQEQKTLFAKRLRAVHSSQVCVREEIKQERVNKLEQSFLINISIWVELDTRSWGGGSIWAWGLSLTIQQTLLTW